MDVIARFKNTDSSPALEIIHQVYGVVDSGQIWPQLTAQLLDLLETLDAALPSPIDDHSLVALLEPHLLRALRLQQNQFAQNGLIELQESLLDKHHLAIAVCDEVGKVHWANRGMQECLANLPGQTLRAMVAAQTVRPMAQRVQMPEGEFTLLALNIPSLGPGRVVLLASTTYAVRLDPVALKSLFQLTDAEIRVAQGLVEGHAPEGIAEQGGTSVHTVRTQLKQLLGKLGANRQSEAVALLVTSPAGLAMQDAVDAPPAPPLLLRMGNRDLAFADYGPRSGRPVIFLHCWGGSRLHVPADVQPLYSHGLRVVVPERPGLGYSSMTAEDSLDVCAADVERLADHLGFASFDVIGHTMGSIVACAVARRMPQRVRSLTLVSPLSPLRGLSDLHGMLPVAKLLAGISLRLPAAAPSLLKLLVGRVRREPAVYFENILPHLPPADAAVMSQPRVRARYLTAVAESIAHGDDGVLKDLRLQTCRWEHLLPVPSRLPVVLWHGEQDRHVPILHSERLLALLPQATLHRVADAGHYLLYHSWDRILAHLAAGR